MPGCRRGLRCANDLDVGTVRRSGREEIVNRAIKGYQPSALSNCHSQEICVGYLSVAHEQGHRQLWTAGQVQVIGPENVVADSSQATEQLESLDRRDGVFDDTGIRGDADQPGLCEW